MRVDVDDLEDPRLDDFRSLRDRDLARERGAFIAEGEELLRRLVDSPWRVRSVLVAEPRVGRVAETLSRLPVDVPVFVAPLPIVSSLVGFPLHRGVLGAGERASAPSGAEILASIPPGPRAVVGLVGLANHDNVGACFRNAAAFGAGPVLIDDETADPLYRKALRVSMGHALRLPFARVGPPSALLDRLEAQGIEAIALTPHPGAVRLEDVARSRAGGPGRFALLVGTEGAGLPPEVLARAPIRLRIPMASGVDSLNVATALAVALHGLRQVWPEAFGSGSSEP